MNEPRVLDDYEVLTTEEQFNSDCDETKSWAIEKIPHLIATIKAKNTEIAELKRHSDHIQEQLWKAFETIEQYQKRQANQR